MVHTTINMYIDKNKREIFKIKEKTENEATPIINRLIK